MRNTTCGDENFLHHVRGQRYYLLKKLSDSEFSVKNDSLLNFLMVGEGYVLVSNEFAEELSKLSLTDISFANALITFEDSGNKSKGYQQLLVKNKFSSENIKDVLLDGSYFFLMDDEYLFATPELKLTLEGSTFKKFKLFFSKGLSEFG